MPQTSSSKDSQGLALITSCAITMIRLLAMLTLLLCGAISIVAALLLAPVLYLYLYLRPGSSSLDCESILSSGIGRLVVECARLLETVFAGSQSCYHGLTTKMAGLWYSIKLRMTSSFRKSRGRNGHRG